jgi:hypothetical protein
VVFFCFYISRTIIGVAAQFGKRLGKIIIIGGAKTFAFDYVYGPSTTQQQVFNDVGNLFDIFVGVI